MASPAKTAEARTAKVARKPKVKLISNAKLRAEIEDAVWVHQTIRQQGLLSKPLTHWVGLYEEFAVGLRRLVQHEVGLKGGN